MPQPLKHDHLTTEELFHYAGLGMVLGVDPSVVKDLEYRVESLHDELVAEQAEDVEETEAFISAFDALHEIFSYEPAREWWPSAYRVYRLLKERQE